MASCSKRPKEIDSWRCWSGVDCEDPERGLISNRVPSEKGPGSTNVFLLEGPSECQIFSWHNAISNLELEFEATSIGEYDCFFHVYAASPRIPDSAGECSSKAAGGDLSPTLQGNVLMSFGGRSLTNTFGRVWARTSSSVGTPLAPKTFSGCTE